MSHVTRHSHASQCLLYINSVHRLYKKTALDQLPLSSQLVPSTQQVSRSSSSSTYIGIASTNTNTIISMLSYKLHGQTDVIARYVETLSSIKL